MTRNQVTSCGERRFGGERRHFEYTLYIPERREGGDRRAAVGSPDNPVPCPNGGSESVTLAGLPSEP